MEVAGATPVPMEAAQSDAAAADTAPVPAAVDDNVSTSRTLFVGNLNRETTHELLLALFNQYGLVKSCKLIRQSMTSPEPYGFVEFEHRENAEQALNAMGGRVILGNQIKVNWAWGGGYQFNQFQAASPDSPMSTQAGTNYYTVFVGDIGPDMSETGLRDQFTKFGIISGCRIVRDPNTKKSKNYGFVSFNTHEDAENAIIEMDGAWIGTRTIRVNWATRRTSGPENRHTENRPNPSKIDQVSSLTGPTNCTIFVGNIRGMSDEMLNDLFSRYGSIVHLRQLQARGFGFITFASKISAIRAIIGMDQRTVHGSSIKVAWGREREQRPQSDQRQPQQFQWSPANSNGNGAGYSMNCYQYMQPPQQQQYNQSIGGMNYWSTNALQGYPFFQNSQPTNPYYRLPLPFGPGFPNAAGGNSQTETRNAAIGGNRDTM